MFTSHFFSIASLLHSDLLAVSLLDPKYLLETFGLIGLIVIIFLESAFAPLPGDSLLFLGGLFSSSGAAFDVKLNLWAVIFGTMIAAILGNQVAYWFGRKVGVALYNRPNSRLFSHENLEKTHHYFEKYGAKTIFLARWIPLVRGLAPIVAGVGRMDYRKFILYNVFGAAVWTTVLPLAGWKLGDSIPADKVDKLILPIVAIIILVSFIPLFVEMYRAKMSPKKPVSVDADDPTVEELHSLVNKNDVTQH